MSDSPERWFLFVQFELPGELGPPDGRYLLRSGLDGQPERVIVLKTLGGRRAAEGVRVVGGTGPLARRVRSRRREAPPLPEPPRVPVTRATIVDPAPVSAERQAQAWLAGLDAEREVASALAALDRLLYFHRLAAADPRVHEVSHAQTLAIRAGWGEGEQVADGTWLFAQELPTGALDGADSPPLGTDPGSGGSGQGGKGSGPGDGGYGPDSGGTGPRDETGPGHETGPGRHRRTARGIARGRTARGRVAALRPDEHLAQLLGARERPLLCEELALRARLDLDQGRVALAAIDLDGALAAAVGELAGEERVDLTARVSELRALHAEIEQIAQAATRPRNPHDQMGPQDLALSHGPIRQALERLEAALRARGAAGYEATRGG